MKNKSLSFPKDFLWGASTSAHQVEGNNSNNWSEWEKENAQRLADEAESKYAHWVPSWKDIAQQAKNPNNYISGEACEHYNRYLEDFEIAKSLNHNAHRFSIEWSRIEPKEGKFNIKEIEHYQKVVKNLKSKNIEPFATLWYWTIPNWLRDKGGLEHKDFVYYFTTYVQIIVSKLPEVKFWMTLNEPNLMVYYSYIEGSWPPQKKNIFAGFKAIINLAKAHRAAYQKIHSINPKAQVGFGNPVRFIDPFSNRLLDRVASWFRDFLANRFFLYLTGNTHDYMGIQYYVRERIKFPQQIVNENREISDMGWEIYPKGIYHCLKNLKKYNKPIYITESGIADMQDKKRLQFIKQHLYWIHKAVREGVMVRGYFYWSLLDNFEWDKGFWPRFGLIEVNYKNQARKIRPSALKYAEIIKKNAI